MFVVVGDVAWDSGGEMATLQIDIDANSHLDSKYVVFVKAIFQ
jgi:hypothetical protein